MRRYNYTTHEQRQQHRADLVSVYNFARQLKTLKGLTPYESFCKSLDQGAQALQS